MWKDIKNKTGYKNMQGNKYLYGNMKILNSDELSKALLDGISTWVKPVPKPETIEQVLAKAKKIRINLLKSLFELEVSKPVDMGGNLFTGGFESAIRIDSAKRFSELKGKSGNITVYDINNRPVSLNPLEMKTLVLLLGDTYMSLLSVKQSILVNMEQVTGLQELTDITIPWEETGDIFNV